MSSFYKVLVLSSNHVVLVFFAFFIKTQLHHMGFITFNISTATCNALIMGCRVKDVTKKEKDAQ